MPAKDTLQGMERLSESRAARPASWGNKISHQLLGEKISRHFGITFPRYPETLSTVHPTSDSNRIPTKAFRRQFGEREAFKSKVMISRWVIPTLVEFGLLLAQRLL